MSCNFEAKSTWFGGFGRQNGRGLKPPLCYRNDLEACFKPRKINGFGRQSTVTLKQNRRGLELSEGTRAPTINEPSQRRFSLPTLTRFSWQNEFAIFSKFGFGKQSTDCNFEAKSSWFAANQWFQKANHCNFVVWQSKIDVVWREVVRRFPT